MSKFYYAVSKGKKRGIYESWAECEKNVNGFPGAIYKKFKTKAEAMDFLGNSKSENEDHGNIREQVSTASSSPLSEFSQIDTDCIAYVDGSFNSVNSSYGYGVLLILKDGKKFPFQGVGSDESLASMRNVTGEIYGAMKAVEEAIHLKLRSITIFYDYMGIECWARGTWKRNKEGTKYYHAFMTEKSKEISIEFHKVKAHSGVKYNELVDHLAKEAVGLV